MLDNRLSLAMSLYTACDVGADIGTDHGLLPCALVKAGICKKMYLCDISPSALSHALNQVKLQKLEESTVCICSDGLQGLPEKHGCGCISIMGMGGRTISDILKRDCNLIDGAALVLSAHTDLPEVRSAIYSIGYHITKENVCLDNGRFYIFWQAMQGKGQITNNELRRGVKLTESGSPVLPEYFERQLWIKQRQMEGLEKAVKTNIQLLNQTESDIEYYTKILALLQK